jgi:hypothetical protein
VTRILPTAALWLAIAAKVLLAIAGGILALVVGYAMWGLWCAERAAREALEDR